MILGIPAYTVLRVFGREFFYNFKAVQKITSGLTPADIGTTITASNEEEELSIFGEENKKTGPLTSKRRK